MEAPAAAGTAVSGSFLTESQRNALDAALAQKAAENAQKAKEHAQHHKASGTGDRKSRAGKGTGAAKKQGAGGKFTWGNLLTNGDAAERVLDENDPNYDSEEERKVVLLTQHQALKNEVQAYKQQVQSIVEEYFSSGDIADVAESLEDLGIPGFMHYFVKRLLTAALDRNNREREMASVALSSLYGNVIPAEQVAKGFTSLVDSIEDLTLDVPDAADLLALFISRAVVDDVLPPAFANRVPDGALRHKLDATLGARHGAEKVLRCWGSGAGISYQDTKDSIAKLLDEYSASQDVAEATRCLHALNVPFFHHEAVKQALHRAMESSAANPALAKSFISLLAQLAETGEVSLVQLHKGLARVSDTLDDLALDNPAAKEQHAAVMEMAKSAGLFALDEANAIARIGRRASDASIVSTSATVAANGTSHGLSAFKKAAKVAIQEYFDSSDAEEVARRLTELNEPGLLHTFPKLAVVSALDRKSRERELVSQLLAALHPKVLSSDQMAAGFTRLLAATDDLVLDCPDAVHLLALFLGRAIVDEVLTPAFLTQVLKGLHSESLGVSVVKAVGALLSARHGAERLTNAWHGGALTLDEIREQMQALIAEYTAGARDSSEAARCLSDLNVPYHHHEAVVVALEKAFEDEKAEADIEALLASLGSASVINQTQMTKGFQRVKASLSEETMDYGPRAADLFARIVAKGTKDGWLVMDAEA